MIIVRRGSTPSSILQISQHIEFVECRLQQTYSIQDGACRLSWSS
jgi:hypothetical protein